jgi:hypothetical protein
MPDYVFDKELNYSVLIDDGIDYENAEFQNKFDNCQVLKLCYDLKSWPIIAYTMIAKAMESDLQKELPVDQAHWPTNEDWAVREKYFLYLAEHEYRNGWREDHHGGKRYAHDPQPDVRMLWRLKGAAPKR